MAILLAFAPFIAFAVVLRLVGPTEGLVAGTLASAALLVRDGREQVLRVGIIVTILALVGVIKSTDGHPKRAHVEAAK